MQGVDIQRVSRPAEKMELGLAAALLGKEQEVVFPGLHGGAGGQGEAAREVARDDAGLGLGEGEGDDALGEGDEA